MRNIDDPDTPIINMLRIHSCRHFNAVIPQFSDYYKRKETFENTDVPYFQAHKKELAAAGFFHIGSADEVLCYFCSAGLRNWEEKDDPWIEHAKFFPRCRFLMVTKGYDFINSHSKTRLHGLEPNIPKTTVTTEITELQCIICLNNEKDCLLLPCKHVCVCTTCVQHLKKCPVCREDIITAIDAYLTYMES